MKELTVDGMKRKVVVRRNARIFDEISPFRDPDSSIRLVGIGDNLHGDANVVYRSPEEFLWDLYKPGMEFSEKNWERMLESDIPKLIQTLTADERYNMYKRYIYVEIDPEAWYYEAEESFDDQVEDLRRYIENLDIGPWVDSAIDYAERKCIDQKKSIIWSMTDYEKKHAMDLFQKPPESEQCKVLYEACEDDPKMMAHAVNLIIDEIGKKFVLIPFWIQQNSGEISISCDMELPFYEWMGKYSGLILAKKDDLAKTYFSEDKWDVEKHSDSVLNLISSAIFDYDCYLNNLIWEIEFIENGHVLRREVVYGYTSEKILSVVRKKIESDESLSGFADLIDQNNYTFI